LTYFFWAWVGITLIGNWKTIITARRCERVAKKPDVMGSYNMESRSIIIKKDRGERLAMAEIGI
jgi:hypothetical protein